MGQAGALSDVLNYLQDCHTVFRAPLPRVHFGSEQRDQAGSTGHFYTHLASLHRVTLAQHARAPDAISAHLAPTVLPKLPIAHSLHRHCFYTRLHSVQQMRKRLGAVAALCEPQEFFRVGGAGECHCL